MRIDVLTLFPDVFDNLNSFSIIKKAKLVFALEQLKIMKRGLLFSAIL